VRIPLATRALIGPVTYRRLMSASETSSLGGGRCALWLPRLDSNGATRKASGLLAPTQPKGLSGPPRWH